MIRRVATASVLLGAATVILVQLERPASVVLWVLLVVGALMMVGWKRWPARPARSPSLLEPEWGERRRPAVALAALELELMAAVDPRLGGERPLRRRLVRLAEHRAGLVPGALTSSGAASLLGDRAASALFDATSLSEEEVELMVERIERL